MKWIEHASSLAILFIAIFVGTLVAMPFLVVFMRWWWHFVVCGLSTCNVP
jgi:hypothetical protein